MEAVGAPEGFRLWWTGLRLGQHKGVAALAVLDSVCPAASACLLSSLLGHSHGGYSEKEAAQQHGWPGEHPGDVAMSRGVRSKPPGALSAHRPALCPGCTHRRQQCIGQHGCYSGKPLFGQAPCQAAIYTCSKYHSCSNSSHCLLLTSPDTFSPLFFPLSLPFSSLAYTLPCPYTGLALLLAKALEAFYYPVGAWPPCDRGGKKTIHTATRCAHTHRLKHRQTLNPQCCPLPKTKSN